MVLRLLLIYRRGLILEITKLLLVEDDTSLATTLKERLSKEGYSICWANSLAKARVELKLQIRI